MSTVDIDKQLREWLADFATGMQGDSYYIIEPDDIYDDDIKELKATLKAELLAKMPKKQYTSVGLVTDPHDLSKGPDGKIPIQNGYNQAITEITKIVNEL